MMMTSESVDDLGLVDGEADGKGPSGDNAADRTDASCTNKDVNDEVNAANDVHDTEPATAYSGCDGNSGVRRKRRQIEHDPLVRVHLVRTANEAQHITM